MIDRPSRRAFIAEVGAQWLTSADARRAYTYIPDDSAIPGIGATATEADALVHIKLFDPCGSWTWYLIEADRMTGEAFALVDGFEVELGNVDLSDLVGWHRARRMPLALPIERDLHFTPRPLSQVREACGARR